MIKNIVIKDEFYILTENKIIFPTIPTHAVLYNDTLIVSFSYSKLRDKYPNSEFWRAVWCYNKFGEINWVVEPPYYIDRSTSKKQYIKCIDYEGRCVDAIDGIEYHEDKGYIEAYGTLGYKLDPETGQLGEIVYRER